MNVKTIFQYLPEARNNDDHAEPKVEKHEEKLDKGIYPCPCCGCKTLPVLPECAIAYICPVCFWENDVFITSDQEESDENGGLTLREARETYQKIGACQERLLPYVRKPRPEELP